MEQLIQTTEVVNLRSYRLEMQGEPFAKLSMTCFRIKHGLFHLSIPFFLVSDHNMFGIHVLALNIQSLYLFKIMRTQISIPYSSSNRLPWYVHSVLVQIVTKKLAKLFWEFIYLLTNLEKESVSTED